MNADRDHSEQPEDRAKFGDAIGSLIDQTKRLVKAEARAVAAEAKVARLTEQLQHECPHGEMSWSGADQADLNDDDKVWVCDNCGKHGTRAALDGDA